MDERADVIFNPAQGDRITFLVTAAQSGGEVIRMRTVLRPGGGNQPHRHPSYSEAFEVLEGTLVVQLGRQRHTVPAGQRAEATPNTTHRFLNQTRETAVFITRCGPAANLSRMASACCTGWRRTAIP